MNDVPPESEIDHLLSEIEHPRGQMTDAQKCRHCSQPGVCCHNFPLFGGKSNNTVEALPTKLHAMVWAAQQMYEPPERGDRQLLLQRFQPRWEGRMLLGLPFFPIEKDTETKGWRWGCVNLTPEGRCGDYENRPYGPCVLFKPGDGEICTLHEDFRK